MADAQRLAYLAGFFDGEGCVWVGRAGGYHRLSVSVSQNDPAPLYLLAEAFGGKVAKAKGGYIWQRASWKAAPVLEALLPYLIVKAEQARLALMFLRMFYVGRQRGPHPLTVYELAERESFAEAFKSIRGPMQTAA